jgi:SAM-dependent methyltransferase
MSETATATDAEQQEMRRERAIHGTEWDRIHGGYFASHAVAEPLTKAIQMAAKHAQPQVIVDLGGGTGFMLHELARHGLAANTRLINLDASAEQLEQVHDPRVKHIQASLPDLRRAQIAKKDERALFIMRSVIHYFGRDGFMSILKKLRRLMQPGERFVHQTACFENIASAKCLNELYELMGTGKWYPLVSALCLALTEAGWQVEATSPAPPLPLGSHDLARRYNLAPAKLAQIQKTLATDCGECTKVFETTRRGFTAYLPYTIFTCVAV